MKTHPPCLPTVSRIACIILALATLTPAFAQAQTTYTWTGAGSDNNWSTAANWSPGPVGSGNGTVLVFSGSTRTSPNNTSPDWNFNLGRLEFAAGAAAFTLTGNNVGFHRYLDTGKQEIFQNSANTQTIGFNAFSFQPGTDSQINLNAGDLMITSPNVYIDSVDEVIRSLYVTGNDTTRRTVTLAGQLNKNGGADPDIYIQNNKRLLVTGSIATGSGNDDSIFIESGVLEFGSTGAMTGGSPVIGATSGATSAALWLNSAGSTFSRQIKIRGGSSGQRAVGGLNTSGTVTYSGNFVSTNSPGDFDLKAATGGTVNLTGARNLNTLLHVNRADAETYGGTVILSGTTSSTQGTGLYAGTLQFSDFNQLGSGYAAFERDTDDSGTLRYTGGSTSITKQLWINKAQTRAAIDVVQPGTTLTWNQSGGVINRNFTKTGAGTLVFSGPITGADGNVGVEAGMLILTASSSYSGGTVVAGGTLEVSGGFGATGGSPAALGTGTVSIGSGGQVRYWLSLSGSNTIANPFSLSGGTLYTTDGFNTYSGRITLASDSSTISAQYEDTITLSGGLAGTGNVLFTQTGGTGAFAAPTYVLSASGSNTGTVRVSGSSGGGATKLQLANVNALQAATLDLATGDQGTVEFTVPGTNTYNLGGLQGSRNLAIGANSLSVGGNGTSTIYTGNLSGSGFFAKTGAGTLVLSGSNTYSGGTEVLAGTLSVPSLSAIGTNYLAVKNGATFSYTGSGTETTTQWLALDVGAATINVANATGSLVWNPGGGTWNQAFTKTGAGSLTLGGGFTSGASVTVAGGLLSLTGSNTYTGPTTVSAGRLQVNSSNAISSGTITLGDSNTAASDTSLFINATTVSATVSRPIVIANQGSGTATLGSASTSGVNFAEFSGEVSLGRDVFLNGGTAGDRLGFTGGISGTGNVNVGGSNRVLFSGAANTYTGSTAILAGATLQLGDGSATATSFIPDASNVNVAGTLNLAKNGNSETINALIGSGTVQAFAGNATLTVGAGNGSGTFAGVLQQTSGTLSLVKAGTGLQALTGANTYTGLTSVVDGELKLNGSIAGGLNVAQIATLSGTGTVGGNATIIGTHSPGTSPGVQTFDANLTYEAGAVVNWELTTNTTGSAGVNYDQIILTTGSLSFSGSTTLALSFDGAGSAVDWSDTFWDENQSWTVYDLSGGTTTGLSNLVLGGSLLDAQGDALSPTTRGYFTTSLSGQDVMLNFVAVPEPSTCALAGVGCVLTALMLRRRKA